MENQRIRMTTCQFCADKTKEIDYKDVILLRKHINTAGKILPPKRTGLCKKHQRMVAAAIKRARSIALLPFVAR
jgi:small subunit ribosomal protein S18